MRLTIRLRLTALFCALFVLLASVLVVTAYLFVSNSSSPEARFEERAQAIAEILADQGVEWSVDGETPTLPLRPPEGSAGPGAGGPLQDVFQEIDAEVRDRTLDELVKWLVIAVAITAAVAIPVAWWLAGRVLRPVDAISTAASSLSEHNLDRRLDDNGVDDEFGRLRRSFNGMLGRLESAFEARQRFAADASHELRTPLAVMRASADNALSDADAPESTRQLAEQVQAQVARSTSLMTSLLTLARADDVARLREPLDLADITADLVAQVSSDAAQSGIEIDLDLSDAHVAGDPVLVERMVANLIDNALKYNAEPRGWVRCRVWTENGHACLRIENAGPTVPATALDGYFQRFTRGSRTEATGHGLGLPIVQRVVKVHGGDVAAAPRAEGGLDVVVTLPVARPASAVGSGHNEA